MNCNNFEAAAGDLASGRLMDATQQESAIQHAASCSACAARLADERALSEGFRFLAKDAKEEAPATVEAAVLAAFREAPVAPAITRFEKGRRGGLYAAAGIAAILLIVLLLALMTSRARDSRPAAPQEAIIDNPAAPEPVPSPPDPKNVQESPQKEVAAIPPGTKRKVGTGRLSRTTSRASLNRPVRDTEIATDFIPLMNRETFSEMEGGQLMRVELPRSALMSFGLPMDMERATERIKADVVVGYDGLARAIRFVR